MLCQGARDCMFEIADKLVRVAIGLRSYKSDGGVHDSMVSDQLVNSNGLADTDGKVTVVPLARTAELPVIPVIRMDRDDPEELIPVVESGSDCK